MKKLLILFVLLSFVRVARGQGNPPPYAAYIYSGGIFTPATSTYSGQGLQFNPPAVALYCYNTSTGQWVPATSACFGGGGGGSGTVTNVSVVTANGISGTVANPTTTPAITIACATCVVASSPGVGVAHFAGSTQTVTSSLIVAADITSGTITGTQIASSVALAGSPTTTTQTACDNSTKAATTAYAGLTCTTVETSGSPLTATAQSQLIWNNTASAYVVDLPTPTATGPSICIGNYKARSSAISFVPGSGITIYYKGVAGTSGSSTGLVSGGAAGDFICVVGTDTTTYEAVGAGQGVFTNN